MRKLVRDAMTANPRTVGMDQSVVDAARIMAEEDIGSIPVVDHDEILAGIVTDRDIALRVVAEGRDPQATRVYEVRPPMSVLPTPMSRWTRRSSRWPITRCDGCR